MLRVTTSWDDGDILDKRLADLLSHYGLKGTFYVAKNYRPERLPDLSIKEIAMRHEIGAHTLTHPDLRVIPPEKLKEEVVGSKRWLEAILGQEIKIFCYPRGFYNEGIATVLRTAGFQGARTTQLGSIDLPANPFHINTTLQVYPFPFRKRVGQKYYWSKLLEPYQQRAPQLRALGVSRLSMSSWLNLAKATFDITLKKGEVFHLWGHSWEIEKYGMWPDLEKFFQYISNRKDCTYITNGQLLSE